MRAELPDRRRHGHRKHQGRADDPGRPDRRDHEPAAQHVPAPPLGRQSLHGCFSPDDPWLRSAAGDICARFYDRDDRPLAFPGSERLLSTDLATLQRIPTTIALATGTEKLLSIKAGARAGWFNQLVTDTATAQALLAAG